MTRRCSKGPSRGDGWCKALSSYTPQQFMITYLRIWRLLFRCLSYRNLLRGYRKWFLFLPLLLRPPRGSPFKLEYMYNSFLSASMLYRCATVASSLASPPPISCKHSILVLCRVCAFCYFSIDHIQFRLMFSKQSQPKRNHKAHSHCEPRRVSRSICNAKRKQVKTNNKTPTNTSKRNTILLERALPHRTERSNYT